MPSDYKKICKDNIRRRGEEFDDIGRLISERLYSDKSHFVYELLQNSEDALERRFRLDPHNGCPRAVQFRLFHDRLEFRHFGVPFDEEDVRGISDVLKGTKAKDFDQIGKFGIGFKSVYAFTASPEVHSGDEHFVIKRYIRPEAKVSSPGLSISHDETVFIFPFNHEDLPENLAFDLISRKLRGLGPRVLLFLRRIDEIEWSVEPSGEKGQYIKESSAVDGYKIARRVAVIGQKNSQDKEENWLVFERPVTVPNGSCDVRVEVGFWIETNISGKTESIVRIDQSPLVVYFPTEKDTRLSFLLQGPYRTTPARDNIAEDDVWNKTLIAETAELVADSLRHLRAMGLLSVSLLEALPIRMEEFPENMMFHPIFRGVHRILMSEELLPTNDGGFVAARNAKLVRGAALMKVLNQEQLSTLCQSNDEINWLSDEITQDRTPDLRSYLMKELNVEEVTPESFASSLKEEFLVKQTDEWFIKFYEFLGSQEALWRSSSSTLRRNYTPILRLEDGKHTVPFKLDGDPKAFLPPLEATDFPIVKRAIASDKKAKVFLERLGLSEPDVFDDIVIKVLPKYSRPDASEIPNHVHADDIRKILRALSSDSESGKRKVKQAARCTAFLRAVDQNGRTAFQKPSNMYFPTENLKDYFGENANVWFLNELEGEGEWRDLGVEDKPRFKKIMGSLTWQEKSNLRGIWEKQYGDTPDSAPTDYLLDGLDDFLSRLPKREEQFEQHSLILWNFLLSHLKENSHYEFYQGKYRWFYYQKRSATFDARWVKQLRSYRWLPKKSDDLPHLPNELCTDDLPDSFDRDRWLVDLLGIKKNVVVKGVVEKDVVAELAEEAGISKTALDRARQIAAASPEVQQQIDSLLKKQETSQGNRNSSPYHEALSEAFSAPGRGTSSDGGGNGGLSQDSGRRRKKTQEDLDAAIENEGEHGQQFSFALRKKWKGKNDQVRVAFREWYGGRCQVCEKTFFQRNGEPYFEGVYLVSRKTAGWLDREGNVICLCAEHSAMFQFGPKEVEEDIVQQVMQLKIKAEGGDDHPSIRMKLCRDPIAIRYAEKHLIDLQEMIRAAKREGH